jgi:1,4-dihydroxy-2-naphthoate polyprenyltransferase
MNNPWLLAIRPKTLFASIGPVILGLSLAVLYSGQIKFLIAFLTLICVLLLQISTNLVNDYFDAKTGVDSNKRLGPQRVTQTSLIEAKQVKQIFTLTFVLAFIIGIYLMIHGGLIIMIIGPLSIAFAYLYTGGPYPLSHYALGELLALIFFGPVAVWGTYYLQTNSFELLPLIAGLGPGFIAAAIMSINNLRDNKSDKENKKITLAVIMGEKKGRLLTLSLILASTIIPVILFIYLKQPWVLLTVGVFYLFIKNWMYIINGAINSNLNTVLARTGMYLFIYCIVFSLGINL